MSTYLVLDVPQEDWDSKLGMIIPCELGQSAPGCLFSIEVAL